MVPLVVMSMCLVPALASAQTPATAGAPAERPWGQSKAGLSASAAATGEWKLAGEMKLDFAIRNTGKVSATLPAREDIHGYLLLAQGKRLHYTERILHARDLPNWPGQLAAGKVLRFPAVDVAALKAFPYKPGLLLINGYPAKLVDGKPQPLPPAGTVAAVLKPGLVKVKYIVHLPRRREGALSLIGKVIRINLALKDFAKLPQATQRRILADLAGRLTKDAWSAQAAHGDAVRIGRAAVGTLVPIATNARAKYFARAWAVTALAQIGGEDAVGVLINCLGDSSEGVRYVAAYHGLRLRDGRFDKALNKRAVSGNDAMVTAWAIMGHLKFRRKVPAALLAAGVQSDQWKARAAVAETIARGNPDRTHLPILRRLVRDTNGMIRQTAAKAIGFVGDSSYETLDALIAALAMDGDNPRHAVAGALSALTGQKWFYPATASKEQKARILRKWQQWWEKNKEGYRKP